MSRGGRQIVDAHAWVLRAEVRDGIAMSFAPLRHRSMVLVAVHTADGSVGYGESWVNYPPWAPVERMATLREGVFPLLLGQDSTDVAGIHQTLRETLGPLGRQWGAPGPIAQAISAVDIALWDLRGKATQAAVSRLLATRTADDVPVYASSLGPKDVAAQAADCRHAGYSAVKIKLGFGRRADEDILAAARETLGAGSTLYVDANQAWTVGEAVNAAPMLNSFGVSWVEEPITGNALADLEQLHRRTGLAIATGENVYGADAFEPYVRSPAIAVVQPDVTKTGGLTTAWRVCEAARSAGKPALPHLYGGAIAYGATLQLAGCAPAVTAIEYDVRANPLRDPLLVDPPRPRRGWVDIPDGPGLGVTLDTEAWRTYDQSSGAEPDRRESTV